MTTSTGTSMDGLYELLAERSRYEAWLVELEARRSAAPPHVIDRVKGDYAGRLTHVTDQLRGRAAELESTVYSLQSRLAGLATQEASRRDERAETELRAAVGEYAPDHASATIEHCNRAIAEIEAERGVLTAELVRMQDVLAKVLKRDEPPAPPPVELVPEVVEEPVAAETEEISILDIAEPDPEPVIVYADAQPDVTAPVLEPVAEIVMEPVVETVLEPITALAPESRPEPVSVENSLAARELEFLHSVVKPANTNDLLPPPVLNAPRRGVTPMSSAAVAGVRDTQENAATSSMPAFLRDLPTEQVKTLKCQECATMNYPTEWYCERCGGELAAM